MKGGTFCAEVARLGVTEEEILEAIKRGWLVEEIEALPAAKAGQLLDLAWKRRQAHAVEMSGPSQLGVAVAPAK